MQLLQNDYLAAYRSLRLSRDSKGVLVAEFHSNGGPFRFTAQDHTEFVDAFYRIAQDRTNKIVILTGAGGEFIPEIDFSSFGNVADPGVIFDPGEQCCIGARHSLLARIAKENAGQNDDGACFRRWIAHASVVGHRESRNEDAGRRVRHIAGRSHIARPGVAARE